MYKKIALSLLATVVLAGCQNVPTKEEINVSENALINQPEEILLKDHNVPLMINEETVNEAKVQILNEGGFSSFKELDLKNEEKQNILNNNTIMFGFDRYNLSKENEKKIELHIDFLKKNNNIKVIVEGHTDERGEKSYNLTLGEKRAKTVKDYMVKKGISANQIEIISLGETKPAINESTKEAWKQNRRSVFVYN